MEMHGYCDLNIKIDEKSTDEVKKLVKHAFYLGYETIALNTYFDGANIQTKKKRKLDEESTVPIPGPFEHGITLDELLEWRNSSSQRIPQILHRLTVSISDTMQYHFLSRSEVYKQYHLISVIPLTKDIFQRCCTTFNVDIVSLDRSHKMDYYIGRKQYKTAIQRGLHFEILYGAMLHKPYICTQTITAAHQYYSIEKGRDIIVCSGASSSGEIRGPYDVMNLSILFGLNEQQCRDSITSNPWKAIHHGERRKGSTFVTMVESIKQIKKQDRWVLQVNRLPNDHDA